MSDGSRKMRIIMAGAESAPAKLVAAEVVAKLSQRTDVIIVDTESDEAKDLMERHSLKVADFKIVPKPYIEGPPPFMNPKPSKGEKKRTARELRRRGWR